MLAAMGEGARPEVLCEGPLCDSLGVFSPSGHGATEYTLYLLYAYSRVDFRCSHFIQQLTDASQHWAAGLWRGVNKWGNAGICQSIAQGKDNIPMMFGSQPQVLDT